MRRDFLIIVSKYGENPRKVVSGHYSNVDMRYVKKSPQIWKILKVKRVIE